MRAVIAIVACLASFAMAQTPLAPVPVPDGDSSFVGSVKVSFTTLVLRNGTIYYTLDGTAPTDKSIQYELPFEIAKTTVLRAIRVRGGDKSPEHKATFTRRKLPAPVAKYGGKLEFVGSMKCTLSVSVKIPSTAPNAGTAPKIYYTIDNEVPQLYTAPVAIAKTSILFATAHHPDYDDSPPTALNFKLLLPVEKPVMDLKTRTFTANPLKVKFTSATAGAYFQYVLFTGNGSASPDTGTLADSVVIVGAAPGDVITLRAIAKKAGMAPSPIAEEKYTYMPPVAAPIAMPAASFFFDSVTISLSSATAGASIYYTLDGTTLPSQSTNEYKGKFLIDSTVNLKAMAFKASQTSSSIFTGAYTLNLSPPSASRASGEFTEPLLKVTLRAKSPTAQILYTLDGKDPTRSSAAFNPGQDTITLTKDSTELRTVAVKGGVMSQVNKYTYVRRSVIKTTPAPAIEPTGRDFLDSQMVTLIPPEPGVAVYFTDDGTEPSRKSRLYTEPFPIRTTTVIKAIAHKPNLDSSAVRQELFVLIPSMPTANPPATASFENRVEVQLNTKTQGAVVKFLLGDQPWNVDFAQEVPASGLVFTSDEKLQAAAVVGDGIHRRVSDVLVQHYRVFTSNPTDSMRAGQVRSLSAGISLTNKGPAILIARLGSFEFLALEGFKDPSHLVTLSAPTDLVFPKVEFSRPANQAQSVYRIGAGGRPEFVGSGPLVEISKPGLYFAATDIQPPVILLVDQTPKSGDATTFKLQVIDNVALSTCEVRGSGLGDAKISRQADVDGFASFAVKNLPGEVKNLWFQATASDAANITRFPAGTASRYYLEQIWTKLTPPAPWAMGGAEKPWDLAGFPIGSASALTWGQIKVDNPDPSLSAVAFRNGDYVALRDVDVIEPGMAFWLGSQNNRTSLVLSKFLSSRSDAEGRYRVTVHPGWNLVTNPSLERMYWPSARANGEKYRQSQLRGLWSYPNDVKDYVASDSLDPWNGYWVYHYGDKDTSVVLLTAPEPVAKRAADNDPGKVEILIDFGRPFPIRLGARSYAKDGVGVEDEPQLPAWNKTRQAWSVRDRSRLMTDVLHFESEQVMQWKLVLEGAPPQGRDSMVTVVQCSLPAGFEAWAWSRKRNLKIRLDLDAGYSLPGTDPDTLLIVAGPAAKVAKLPELAGAVESVTLFASRPGFDREGSRLYLALPMDALVKAELWSLSGRHLGSIHSGKLGSGQHRLPIPATRDASGIVLIRLQVRGQGWAVDRVHKVAH